MLYNKEIDVAKASLLLYFRKMTKGDEYDTDTGTF